jgi:hypothetical protein
MTNICSQRRGPDCVQELCNCGLMVFTGAMLDLLGTGFANLYFHSRERSRLHG